jgi:hypothetical protein
MGMTSKEGQCWTVRVSRIQARANRFNPALAQIGRPYLALAGGLLPLWGSSNQSYEHTIFRLPIKQA